MVAEKDIEKVREALVGTDYEVSDDKKTVEVWFMDGTSAEYEWDAEKNSPKDENISMETIGGVTVGVFTKDASSSYESGSQYSNAYSFAADSSEPMITSLQVCSNILKRLSKSSKVPRSLSKNS